MLHSLFVEPILFAAVVYIAFRSVYRLCFHPLRDIPGPKLAAVTHLYEFYYDVILGGRFLLQIGRMHQQYGPIVRISPREIHICDPNFYDEIYSPSSRRRERDPKWIGSVPTPTSMVGTVGHEHHRFRRSILSSFFSKRSVHELAPRIEAKVHKLMQYLAHLSHTQSVVLVDSTFAALTADTITEYIYGKPWGFLDDAHLGVGIRNAINTGVKSVHIARFIPFLYKLLRRLPVSIVAILNPGLAALYHFQDSLQAEMLTDSVSGRARVHHTILDRLTDPSLPPRERTLQRIQDEGLTFILAGTETTARVLTVATFFLARDKSVLYQLREELKQVMPLSMVLNPAMPRVSDLEKLPYLTAVILEALRMGDAAVARFPRIAPNETLIYGKYIIPAGTSMGSSSYFINRDPSIFPSPHTFMPSRWIKQDGATAPPTRHIISFGKGSRACLGMNLAYFELFLTIACLTRSFDIELENINLDDIKVTRERLIGLPEGGEMRVYARLTQVT